MLSEKILLAGRAKHENESGEAKEVATIRQMYAIAYKSCFYTNVWRKLKIGEKVY